MAQIVVFASGADADKAREALKAAGLDAQIVGATAANLLHIVIGMVGDQEDDEDDEDDDTSSEEDTAPEEDVDAEVDDAGGMDESLGVAIVDGIEIQARQIAGESSVLYAAELEEGPKTTYKLAESSFSFWPSNPAMPSQRIIVEVNSEPGKMRRASLEVPVVKSTTSESYLAVGADLLSLFTK